MVKQRSKSVTLIEGDSACVCVDHVFVCEGNRRRRGGGPKGSVEGGYSGSGVRSPLSAGVDSYRRWSKMRILLGRLPAHPARK